MKKQIFSLVVILLMCLICAAGCASEQSGGNTEFTEEIPVYSGKPYIEIEQNQPDFTENDFQRDAFESYSPLDSLGRCGTAFANVGPETMPHEKRGSIGMIKPSGWKTQRYENVDGKYLYNRCHLLGYQLTGENANERNLITGTREMNTEGMLPFENMIADYIKETGNHVLYRVTPIFDGNNLVASGVQMEAESVEDRGEGISFHVYAYNNQPGIVIDYATGESHPSEESEKSSVTGEDVYVLNTNTHKFHRPDCSSVGEMKGKNKEEFRGSRSSLIQEGYEPCGNCKP